MCFEIINLSDHLDHIFPISLPVVLEEHLDVIELGHNLLQVLNEPVHSLFLLQVGLVDDADVDITVVPNGFTERFQVGVDELREFVYTLIQHLEVGEHGLLNRILDLLDLVQGSSLVLFEELVKLRSIDWQVALDDLKSLVHILLHVLMVD
jgi:hypothetical protein